MITFTGSADGVEEMILTTDDEGIVVKATAPGTRYVANNTYKGRFAGNIMDSMRDLEWERSDG